jgi:PAS domain S-box-containing protein
MTDRQKLLQALPAVERYAATVLAVVCTLAIRMVLDPFLGDRAPYLFFVLMIVVVKRLWGRGPGLLATLLGGVATWYFIIEPRFSFAIASRVDALNLGAYFAVGAGISFLGEVSSRLPASMAVGGRIIKPRVVRQTAVLAGAAVVLIGMVLLLLRDFERTQAAQGWVAHTYQVIDSAESLKSMMKDAETGERGFLLTGDESYLAPYNLAIAGLPRGLKELKNLTSDNPAQQARWVEINRLTSERLRVLKHAIELRKVSQVDAALALVRYGRGEPAMDELRSTLDAVISEERRLLAERTAQAAVEGSRERWVLGLGSAALVLLLVFASVVIERETVRREEITQALGRHAGLLEQAHDSLITWPLGGAIDYWSRGAETLYGYTREEALGRSSHELLHTEHPLGMAQIEALLESGGQWKGELTQATKDGQKLIVEAQWTLAVDADGKKTVLEANRDITERKRAEEELLESEERFRALVTASSDVVYRMNADWTEMRQLRGRNFIKDTEEPNRHWLQEYIHPDDQSRVTAVINEAIRTKSIFELEHRVLRVGGALGWTFSRAIPRLDAKGEIVEWFGAASDITARKQAEAENILLATAIEQAAETVVITDRDATIQYVNPAFTRTTGYTRDEALGRNPRVLKSGRHDGKFYLNLWATLTAGKLWRGEFTNRRKDGTLYTEEATIAPVRDASGEITNFIAIKYDITERKQAEEALEESELRYRQLFERSESALALHEMIFDAQGNPCDYRFLDVNPAFERNTGLTRTQTVGHTAIEILPGLEEFWIDFYGRVAVTGQSAVFENYTRPLGRYYAGSAYSPRPNQFAVTFLDVTERKRAEEEVRLLNVELEERVRSRTAALEAANRELEAFAHSVSHDLRAPLRGIDGWSLALLEDYGERLDAQGHKYLDRVRSEAQRMGRLIDDLLHLSRVGRAELLPRSVDLSSLAETIAARLKESHPDRFIEFIVAPQLKCTGDARLLEIALTNLLDNAVKFTGTCSVARVEFGWTEHEGKPAFFVRDNGVGFDMAYAGMLFGPFQRLHKASEFPGSGIGLATVQRVIHRHGGRIWAEAQVGAGATLYFTLGADK